MNIFVELLSYMVGGNEDGPLVSMPLKEFICSLGARSSAPGGGSASAAVAAIVSRVNYFSAEFDLSLYLAYISFKLFYFVS